MAEERWRNAPIEIVVEITMASDDHTLDEVRGVVDAVWGIYAGALLTANADKATSYQMAQWWHSAQDFAPPLVRRRRRNNNAYWNERYTDVARDLQQTRSPLLSGARVSRLEHHSPLVLEVVFVAAFVPLVAMHVVHATFAAVIRLRESVTASKHRQRERDLSLSIREAIADEIRRNGVGSVDPKVVTAALATQEVPAADLLSPAIKEILMTVGGTKGGK